MTRAPQVATRRGPYRASNRRVRGPRLKGPERRKQLLGVARELLSAEGLSAVTMERVAATANISKPVLYSHFANRAELLLAILEQLWADLDRAVSERLRGGTTFDEQLEGFVSGYFDAIRRAGPGLQLLVSNQSEEPEVEEVRKRRQRQAEARWSEVYQVKLGLPKATADAAAAILRSAVEGATSYWLHSPRHSRELCRRVCLSILRAGLAGLADDTRETTRASATGAR